MKNNPAIKILGRLICSPGQRAAIFLAGMILRFSAGFKDYCVITLVQMTGATPRPEELHIHASRSFVPDFHIKRQQTFKVKNSHSA